MSDFLKHADLLRTILTLSEVQPFLDQNFWPRGLQNGFASAMRRMPLRFFICDDSGSVIF